MTVSRCPWRSKLASIRRSTYTNPRATIQRLIDYNILFIVFLPDRLTVAVYVSADEKLKLFVIWPACMCWEGKAQAEFYKLFIWFYSLNRICDLFIN